MEDMLGGATLVMGSAVLADVLDTPVAKLTVSEYIDLCYNFFDCWSLFAVSIVTMILRLGPSCPELCSEEGTQRG